MVVKVGTKFRSYRDVTLGFALIVAFPSLMSACSPSNETDSSDAVVIDPDDATTEKGTDSSDADVIDPDDATTEEGMTVGWADRLSGDEYIEVLAVVGDNSGNLYLAGETESDLGEGSNAGGDDAFVAKYDDSGTQEWIRLLGTAGKDTAKAVSRDGSGNIYVAGETSLDLAGKTNSGESDAFIAKYNASGDRQWVRLMGTDDADGARAVGADDSGNVYVAGDTLGRLENHDALGKNDAFIAKYSPSGDRKWVEVLASSDHDLATALAVHGSGAIFVAGETNGKIGEKMNAGESDAFLAKYDSSGSRRRVTLLGTSSDEGVAALASGGAGGVYLAGYTEGDLNGEKNHGENDGYVAKYDSAGKIQWTRIIGTPEYDRAHAAAVDSSGNVFVSGPTRGEFGGEKNSGVSDVYIVRYDAAGNRSEVKFLDGRRNDEPRGLAAVGSGQMYVAGQTKGELAGTEEGSQTDGFLVRLNYR